MFVVVDGRRHQRAIARRAGLIERQDYVRRLPSRVQRINCVRLLVMMLVGMMQWLLLRRRHILDE